MASFQSAMWINKQPNTDPAKTSLTYICCNDWTKSGALAFMRQPEEGIEPSKKVVFSPMIIYVTIVLARFHLKPRQRMLEKFGQ